MAEPLKNSFGLDVVDRIGASLLEADPGFPLDRFLASARDGFLDLELTARARKITEALAETLPADRGDALRILRASLGPPLAEVESDGMASFLYLPHVFFVADHGLGHFEEAMEFQYEVTRRFTAEFSIRAFLDHHTDATLERLAVWATDPDMHVRRLVSEGTRPRLPWAPRLRRFVDDPSPVVSLLEELKDDPAEYVRRSVANNLNDISKDHPDLVVAITSRWAENPGRRRLVRHALRTLVKAGNPGALEVLGFGGSDGLEVEELTFDPPRPSLGTRVVIGARLANRTSVDLAALVDLRVHFVRANGGSGAKVFKGKELMLGPHQSGEVRKTISLADHTTRTTHPGVHGVDVVVNGTTLATGNFEVVSTDD